MPRTIVPVTTFSKALLKHIVCLLLSLSGITAITTPCYSQHPGDWAEACTRHGGPKPDPKHPRVLRDGGPNPYCPTCKTQQEEQSKKWAEEEKRRLQTIEDNKAKWKQAQEEAERQKQRDLQYLAEAEASKAALQQLKAENEQKSNAARAAFEQRMQAEKKRQDDYINQLTQLQQSFAAKAQASGDEEFWDATVEMANYEPIRQKTKITDKNNYTSERELYGFKNKAGNLVIPCRYANARPFHKGVAAVVRLDENYWVLIDAKEQVIARFDDNFCYGYKLRSNNILIDTFFDGIATVTTTGYDDLKVGAIDIKGNMVVKPVFKKLGHFQNGVAIADQLINSNTKKSEYTDNCDYIYAYYHTGLIDKTGQWVNPPRKKLKVVCGGDLFVLTMESSKPNNMTYAEWEAQKAANKVQAEQGRQKERVRMEQERDRIINDARAQGMIIETD